MKEPIAEIVQLPKSPRALREESEAAFFPTLAFLLLLMWIGVFMFSPGQVSAAWTKVKANWAAKQNEAAQALAAAQAQIPAPPVQEFNDDDRAAIQDIVSLASE